MPGRARARLHRRGDRRRRRGAQRARALRARPRSSSRARAPQLQRILDEALDEGGWFGRPTRARSRKAAGATDPDERAARACARCSPRRRGSGCSSASRSGASSRTSCSTNPTRGDDHDGHPLSRPRRFELTDGDTTRPRRPVPDRQPEGRRRGRRPRARRTILLTHGHADHFGDTVDIAKRTGAPVVAIVELASEIGEEGVENVFDPNIGGTVEFDWGWVQARPRRGTPSTTPKRHGHTRRPGLLINLGGKTGLPPRRHRAVLRPAAGRAPRRRDRRRARCRSAATTRWTATTP